MEEVCRLVPYFVIIIEENKCKLISIFLNFKLALERQKTAEKERLFLVYAKQWWREYLQIRPSHNSRLVKIFAQVCKLYEKSFTAIFEIYWL